MNFIYETDRLLLKVLHPEDAAAVLQFFLDNKELFEEYEPDRPDSFYTTAYQKTVLLCEYNLTLKLSAVRFYVFKKEEPEKIIGTVCLRNIRRSVYQSCEVGYKFDAANQHQGYAREALSMLISIAFDALKLHRMEAYVRPDNSASIRLLEALDFTCEGIARDCVFLHNAWQSHYRYSLLSRP